MRSLLNILLKLLEKGGKKAPKPRNGPKPSTGKPCATGKCNRLPKPPKAPARRHNPCKTKGNDPTKEKNSMLDPDVDVAGDLDAMKSGNFTRSGNDIMVNGRTYEMHGETGTIFPKSGPGVVQMDRGQHQFLKMLNSGSLENAMKFANNFPGLDPDKAEEVLELWKKC